LLTRVRAGQSPSPSGRGVRGEGGAGLSPSTKFGLQIYTRLVTHPRLYAASQKFAALGSLLFASSSQWIRLPAFTGWGYSKDFPRFVGKTFRDTWNKNDVILPKEHRDYVSKATLPGTARQGKCAPHASAGEDLLHNDRDSSVAPLPQSDMDKVGQFTSELTALSGHVYQTKNVTKDIIEFLKTHDINKIHLEPKTMDENLLREANIEFTYCPDLQTPVGVTNALCGLADTGSVLIADGEGSPLHASLLPEIHIAVLKSSDILSSLSDAMPLLKNSSAAVFITGPSRTADIEMTLTIGVHGPKEIHVFVDDSISE